MYAVAFKSQDNKQLNLSVVADAGYALILPWMPVPVSMITLTQVVSGTSTVVARAAIGREIPDLKHLALTVDGTAAKVYFRGRLLMVGTLSTTMTIDRVELQGGTKDTLLSEMLLMPRVAEPEDIAVWHNLRAPFYDPSPHIPAEHQPVTVKGAGADIDIDKFGIRATRKADGKKTFEIDAETGDVHFEGDGVFRGRVEASEGYFHGRVEAEEGYFRGDITGATGTFSGELAAKSIKAEWFEEIRNVLPYTGQDSLDADKPIVIPFYIPSETTKIVAAFLSAEARRYRAYAKSAPYDPDAFWLKQTKGISFNSPAVSVVLDKSNAATGSTSLDHYHQYSDTHIVSSAGGGHSHPLNTAAWPKLYTDYTNPGDGHNHLHTLDSLVIPSNSGTHTHSTTSTTKNTGGSQRSGILEPNDLSHSHTYERVVGAQLNNFNNHFHDFDPAHDHKLEFGIHEDTTPANVRIRINNGSGWSEYISLAPAPSGNAAYDLIAGASVPKHNNNASEMDLTPYLSGTGWKHIEFSSSRLGLIAWNIILKLDITA